LTIAALAILVLPLRAQSSWPEEFGQMPLSEKVSTLERRNCVRVMLNSFRRNSAVKALIFMPGATDELYFFNRVNVVLSNATPTLLDAVTALTNQTFIRATVVPPFLVLHTDEDPLEPVMVVQDQHTADRIHKKHFEKHGVFNDRDWDFMQPILSFDLDTKMRPDLEKHASYHFFRHSFAEFDLDGWDALRAVALAGKTKVTITRKKVTFEGDERYMATPVAPTNFLNRIVK
jgi:hypothetical protein